MEATITPLPEVSPSSAHSLTGQQQNPLPQAHPLSVQQQESQLSASTLNERQREAAEQIGRSIAVIAGPGTGKTKTLIARLHHLLEVRKIPPEEITAVTFTNKAAEEMLARMDYDDLLLETLKLLKDFPEDARKRKCFSYLLIDEFQDINPLQYELIKEWGYGGRELFVIGDPDQSILFDFI